MRLIINNKSDNKPQLIQLNELDQLFAQNISRKFCVDAINLKKNPGNQN